jgi:hypothetical protein
MIAVPEGAADLPRQKKTRGSIAGVIDSDVTLAPHIAAPAHDDGSIRSFPALLQIPLLSLAVDANRMEA